MPDSKLVVFDCVVLVQSLISRSGPAVRCLELFEQGEFAVAVSDETLSEAREVLSRSGLRRRYPSLTDERVSDLLERLVCRARVFRNVAPRFQYSRDPDDEPYLNLAIQSRADYLVTRDRDMLDLARRDLEPSLDFQRRFPFLSILDPVAFLKILRGQEEGVAG